MAVTSVEKAKPSSSELTQKLTAQRAYRHVNSILPMPHSSLGTSMNNQSRVGFFYQNWKN